MKKKCSFKNKKALLMMTIIELCFSAPGTMLKIWVYAQLKADIEKYTGVREGKICGNSPGYTERLPDSGGRRTLNVTHSGIWGLQTAQPCEEVSLNTVAYYTAMMELELKSYGGRARAMKGGWDRLLDASPESKTRQEEAGRTSFTPVPCLSETGVCAGGSGMSLRFPSSFKHPCAAKSWLEGYTYIPSISFLPEDKYI